MAINSKMGRLGAGLTGAFMLSLAWGNAQATVIDFGPLVGANGSAYGGHVEDGFTITPTAGQWFEAHLIGLPTPSIFGGPVPSPINGTLRVTGGQFNFNRVDLRSNNAAGTTYSIGGLLGGLSVLAIIGTIGNADNFNTISSGVQGLITIDELFITLRPGSNTTSFNLDNIIVTSVVPVPAAAWMFLTALGGLGLFGWRRRATA